MSDMSDFDDEMKTVDEAEPLWQRFLYMLVFWLLGYMAFCLSIFLAAVQLVFLLVTKSKNDELAAFSRRLIQYVWECLAFIVFAREEKPFPFAAFPTVE